MAEEVILSEEDLGEEKTLLLTVNDIMAVDSIEEMDIRDIEHDRPLVRIGETLYQGTYQTTMGSQLIYQVENQDDKSKLHVTYVGKSEKELAITPVIHLPI